MSNEITVKSRRRNEIEIEKSDTPKRGREAILSKVQKYLSEQIQKIVDSKG